MQLDTPAAVEAARTDYIATGSPEAWQSYERALYAWLYPDKPSTPKPGSWAWHYARQAVAAPAAEVAHPETLMAAE